MAGTVLEADQTVGRMLDSPAAVCSHAIKNAIVMTTQASVWVWHQLGLWTDAANMPSALEVLLR